MIRSGWRSCAAWPAAKPGCLTALGLAQSTVSEPWPACGTRRLVEFRAQARQSFYRLTRPELIDLLGSAEALLAATGEAVALCPVYGAPEAAT